MPAHLGSLILSFLLSHPHPFALAARPPGDSVTAGTMNCDGTVTVRAEHSGQQTVIADIVRMVRLKAVKESSKCLSECNLIRVTINAN